MSWYPSFKLYNSSGTSLIYHIEYVITTNYPEDNPSSVVITNLRSSKGIVVPGGDNPYDLRLRGVLIGTDYTDLQSQIDTMKSSIEYNTSYILKIDTSPSTQDSINVTRISPIIFEEGRRTKTQYYSLTFLANSW